MAERVVVFDRDFAKPNEINGFAIISRNRNNLASSILRRRCVRLPAFADFSISMALEMTLDMGF